MPRLTPAGFRAWPASFSATPFSASSCRDKYEAGYSGILYDPETPERVRDVALATGGVATLEEAASANGWVNAGAGGLTLPYIAILLGIIPRGEST